MSYSFETSKREVGRDTTYRARRFVFSHQTHGCIQLFRQFLGGRCARALGHCPPALAFPPSLERAHGALREVLP